MADVRRARREAEKAAREALSGTLVDSAGELGVALAGQTEAAANVTAARAKAKALVDAAHAEGDALIVAAVVESGKADEVYLAAWTAGKDAGWAPAQLRAMGYAKPPAARRTPSASTSDSAPETSDDSPAAEHEGQHEHDADEA